MMNKQEIIAAINEYITTNGVQEITGQVMNLILNSITNVIPDDALITSSYGGVVKPTDTIPTTPGIGRWFIAEAGSYPNNGDFTFIKNNLNILSYDGINWDKSEITFPSLKLDEPGGAASYESFDAILKPFEIGGYLNLIPNAGAKTFASNYNNDSHFTYLNHAIMNGKLVRKIILDVAQDGTLTILKGKNIGLPNYTFIVATQISIQVSKTSYDVNIQLGQDEALLFGVNGDTGLFWVSNQKNNNVGGSLMQRNNTTGNWLTGSDFDLRIGVVIEGANIGFKSETIEDLYLKANAMNKKKISIISDSIGTYEGSIPNGFATFYPQFNVDTIEKTWWKILSFMINGEILTNNSWSGSSVANIGASSLQNRLDIIEPLTELTFMMMGVNDHYNNVPLGSIPTGSSYNLNEFSGAYKNAIDRNLEYYPNSRLICLTPMRYYSTILNNLSLSIDAYCDRIIDICKVCGVECIDMRYVGHSAINQSVLLPDQLHPNEEMMRRIAEYIKARI